MEEFKRLIDVRQLAHGVAGSLLAALVIAYWRRVFLGAWRLSVPCCRFSLTIIKEVGLVLRVVWHLILKVLLVVLIACSLSLLVGLTMGLVFGIVLGLVLGALDGVVIGLSEGSLAAGAAGFLKALEMGFAFGIGLAIVSGLATSISEVRSLSGMADDLILSTRRILQKGMRAAASCPQRIVSAATAHASPLSAYNTLHLLEASSPKLSDFTYLNAATCHPQAVCVSNELQ